MVNHHGSSNALRFLRCMVAGTTYCLSMTHVRGIRRSEELQGSPAASGLSGWLPGESGTIPVFRLTALLKQPGAQDSTHCKILLLKTDRHPWGILVDRIDSVIQVAASKVFPLPGLARNPAAAFFEGVVQYEDAMLLVLSPAGLRPEELPEAAGASSLPHPPESLYAGIGIATGAGAGGRLIQFATAPDRAFTFGLSLSQVPQILRALPLLPVPGAAPYMLGLAEWRNVPLAVLDLSQRLGGPTAPLTAGGRLLVARAARSRAFVGLAIQPQISMHHLPMAHRESTRHVPLQVSLLKGRFELKNDLLLIPDIDQLFVAHDSAITPEDSRAGRETFYGFPHKA